MRASPQSRAGRGPRAAGSRAPRRARRRSPRGTASRSDRALHQGRQARRSRPASRPRAEPPTSVVPALAATRIERRGDSPALEVRRRPGTARSPPRRSQSRSDHRRGSPCKGRCTAARARANRSPLAAVAGIDALPCSCGQGTLDAPGRARSQSANSARIRSIDPSGVSRCVGLLCRTLRTNELGRLAASFRQLSPQGARVSERWLIAGAKRGDHRAVEALPRRYDWRVLAIVRTLRLPHGVGPHDVVQAARLGVLGAIHTWRPGGASFPSYVRTCARRPRAAAAPSAEPPANRRWPGPTTSRGGPGTALARRARRESRPDPARSLRRRSRREARPSQTSVGVVSDHDVARAWRPCGAGWLRCAASRSG